MVNCVAIFKSAKVVVVLAGVAEHVHDCVVVGHEVVGDIHEDTDTLRVVILDWVDELTRL